MAIIICKECRKEISDKSKVCIHCGCPIEYTNNQCTHFNVVIDGFESGLSKYNKILKMIQDISFSLLKNSDGYTTYNNIEKHFYESGNKLKQTPFDAFCNLKQENALWISKLLNKYGVKYRIVESESINGFDDDSLIDESISKIVSNLPQCPTCHSHDVSTISEATRIKGTIMFGVLSKSAKSQFQCMNCGYKW